MNNQEIIQIINSFESWYYRFDLKGNLTPVKNERWINRHLQRKKYFFDPLVQLSGGSLAGKRILDLGCNAGFWSLAAIENGAESVLGIDGRKMYVDQANFVFETKDIAKSKYQFIQGNIFEVDLKKYGSFDIVLCLGFLSHTSKPICLMELISQVNADILIIETFCSRLPGSFFEFRNEDSNRNLSAIDYPMVLRPTKVALTKMVRQFGYSVVMLKPRFQNYSGCADYRNGAHRAFLCTRNMDLSNIPIRRERITFGTQLVDLCIYVASCFYNPILRWLARKLPERRISSTI
jgi:tRNA (mo5U34)-methyltransferase